MEKYPPGRERHGAQFDRGRMDALFKMLCFDVTCCVDEKADDLKSRLIQISEYVPRETPDCFVCFVSAHGNTDEHGHYITDVSESKVYTISDILKPFMTCDRLKGIPKVFFINACRGEYRSTDSMVDCVLKTGKDSLVVFSTEEGHESARCPISGTYFVQALYEAIYENREKEDVGAMVTIANKMLRKTTHTILKGNKDKRTVMCRGAPSHSNLTGKLYWRTRDPSECSAGKYALHNSHEIEENAMIMPTFIVLIRHF